MGILVVNILTQSVLEEYYVIDKYKGYCKCEKCVSTALLKGKDKPQKLKKLHQDY